MKKYIDHLINVEIVEKDAPYPTKAENIASTVWKEVGREAEMMSTELHIDKRKGSGGKARILDSFLISIPKCV